MADSPVGRHSRDRDITSHSNSGFRSSRARSPSLSPAHRHRSRETARRFRRERPDIGRSRRQSGRSISTDGRAGLRRHDEDQSRDDRRAPPSRRRERSTSDYSDDHRSSRREKRYRARSRSWSRDRSRSRPRHAMRSRSPALRRSKSPPTQRRRRLSKSRSPPRRSKAPLPSQDESFSGQLPPGEKPPDKQKPNFKPTGLLAREANTVQGTNTVLKYHEPPEARKPSARDQWRLYVFKKKDLLDTIHLHQRSVWLMGRDPKVTDLLLEHPSISKQHAVIQFRHLTTTNEYGDRSSMVKPYLIDLEAANGTKLNGKKVEASRYIELVDQDVIAFGESEREYVVVLPSAEK